MEIIYPPLEVSYPDTMPDGLDSTGGGDVSGGDPGSLDAEVPVRRETLVFQLDAHNVPLSCTITLSHPSLGNLIGGTGSVTWNPDESGLKQIQFGKFPLTATDDVMATCMRHVDIHPVTGDDPQVVVTISSWTVPA